MKVRIEIKIDDSKAIVPILKSDIADGTYFKHEGGLSVKTVPQSTMNAFPGFDIIVFIFEFATAVSAGLIANWLYERLKDKGATIIIGSKEVRIENAEKLTDAILEVTVQKEADE